MPKPVSGEERDSGSSSLIAEKYLMNHYNMVHCNVKNKDIGLVLSNKLSNNTLHRPASFPYV